MEEAGRDPRRSPPNVDWLFGRPKTMLALTVIGFLGGLGFSVVSVVALAEGRGVWGWMVVWVVATLVNAWSLRRRIAVLRDPEGERRRFQERYDATLSQPRRTLLLKGALLGLGFYVLLILFGLSLVSMGGYAAWYGWVIVAMGAIGVPYVGYRTRHPHFERDGGARTTGDH